MALTVFLVAIVVSLIADGAISDIAFGVYVVALIALVALLVMDRVGRRGRPG